MAVRVADRRERVDGAGPMQAALAEQSSGGQPHVGRLVAIDAVGVADDVGREQPPRHVPQISQIFVLHFIFNQAHPGRREDGQGVGPPFQDTFARGRLEEVLDVGGRKRRQHRTTVKDRRVVGLRHVLLHTQMLPRDHIARRVAGVRPRVRQNALQRAMARRRGLRVHYPQNVARQRKSVGFGAPRVELGSRAARGVWGAAAPVLDVVVMHGQGQQ